MILTFLDGIKDHRRAQGLRYELKYIVLFSIMGMLSNGKSYRDIARFINEHYDRLSHDFGLNWKKPPGYTTVRNILQGISRQELERCFREYSLSLSTGQTGSCRSIAVDGKVLRKSFDNFNDRSAAQILSFFACGPNIILAHEHIDAKTNEIPVAQRLISSLGLGDVVFTLDALHCQKELFELAEGENEEKKTSDTGEGQPENAVGQL